MQKCSWPCTCTWGPYAETPNREHSSCKRAFSYVTHKRLEPPGINFQNLSKMYPLRWRDQQPAAPISSSPSPQKKAGTHKSLPWSEGGPGLSGGVARPPARPQGAAGGSGSLQAPGSRPAPKCLIPRRGLLLRGSPKGSASYVPAGPAHREGAEIPGALLEGD